MSTPNNTRREQCRAAQRRYMLTAKGKAAKARYAVTAKRRVAQARYEATPRGAAMLAIRNARKIKIGRRYIGTVPTMAEAETINTHIRSRVHEFVERQQSRTQTESI